MIQRAQNGPTQRGMNRDRRRERPRFEPPCERSRGGNMNHLARAAAQVSHQPPVGFKSLRAPLARPGVGGQDGLTVGRLVAASREQELLVGSD